MKISIITVCYNSADTIADTLRSIAQQTYPNIEYIIIDGGSTDGTLDIIKQYEKHVSVLVSEPDKGIYDAMNKGWKRATGDVVAFLNSDDCYMHKNVLSEVAEIMSNPDIDACHGDLIYVDRVDTNKIIRYWQGHEHRAGDCLKGWMPAHPTFFARRSLFERCGGFDTRYRKQADFELAVRWFEIHKIRSRYVPKIWTRMRTGGASNNSLRNIIKGNLESYHACKALGFNVTPFFIVRKILSRFPQYWRKPEIVS
jgi:glycosyltransferase involved in cell wall biosynthesis